MISLLGDGDTNWTTRLNSPVGELNTDYFVTYHTCCWQRSHNFKQDIWSNILLHFNLIKSNLAYSHPLLSLMVCNVVIYDDVLWWSYVEMHPKIRGITGWMEIQNSRISDEIAMIIWQIFCRFYSKYRMERSSKPLYE